MKLIIGLTLVTLTFSIQSLAGVGCREEAIAAAKSIVSLNAAKLNQAFSVNELMMGSSLNYFDSGSIDVPVEIGDTSNVVDVEFDNGENCLIQSVKIR